MAAGVEAAHERAQRILADQPDVTAVDIVRRPDRKRSWVSVDIVRRPPNPHTPQPGP